MGTLKLGSFHRLRPDSFFGTKGTNTYSFPSGHRADFPLLLRLDRGILSWAAWRKSLGNASPCWKVRPLLPELRMIRVFLGIYLGEGQLARAEQWVAGYAAAPDVDGERFEQSSAQIGKKNDTCESTSE